MDLTVRSVLLAAAILCLGATLPAAFAQSTSTPPPEEDYTITDVKSARDECGDDAPQTELQDIIREPDRFAGQCVRVSGVVDGWLIYVNRAAYRRRANWNHQSNSPYRHIGTYPQEATEAVSGRGVQIDAIGKVDTCERLDSDPHVFMVLGYCHHFSGPFLRVARIQRASNPSRH